MPLTDPKRGVAQALSRYRHLHERVVERVKDRVYGLYEPDHVFDISVDDMHFQMSFGNMPIAATIVERIEGRREPETIAAIKAMVRPGARVLELGGAFGYFTTVMAKCAGAEGRVVSVEGTPSNFRILEKNLRRNGLDNVSAHMFFISAAKEGALTFYENARDEFEGAVERLTRGTDGGGDGKGTPVEVPLRRLSKFLQELDFVPTNIFMDIEGFEVDVFEDLGAEWLRKHRPAILFETHSHLYPGLYPAGDRHLDWIKELLADAGYVTRLSAGNLVCLPK